jgi:hypothetical protein
VLFHWQPHTSRSNHGAIEDDVPLFTLSICCAPELDVVDIVLLDATCLSELRYLTPNL